MLFCSVAQLLAQLIILSLALLLPPSPALLPALSLVALLLVYLLLALPLAPSETSANCCAASLACRCARVCPGAHVMCCFLVATLASLSLVPRYASHFLGSLYVYCIVGALFRLLVAPLCDALVAELVVPLLACSVACLLSRSAAGWLCRLAAGRSAAHSVTHSVARSVLALWLLAPLLAMLPALLLV